MNELLELERTLTSIEFLADTFIAMDIANQTDALILPDNALLVPADALKYYSRKARELQLKLLQEKTSGI